MLSFYYAPCVKFSFVTVFSLRTVQCSTVQYQERGEDGGVLADFIFLDSFPCSADHRGVSPT